MLMITGATGTVGRPLIELLVEEGADVRAVSRDPAAAALPAEVEVVSGDPSRPDSIALALDGGVTELFLNPAAVRGAAGDLLALAGDRGVRRVVLLSALAVDDDAQPPSEIATYHRSLEHALTATGLEWVILRPGMFAANTIYQWASQIRAGDVVRGPYAASTDAPIHERDVATAGARALLGADLVGRRLRMTGPQSLTREEMVAIVGAVIGRSLRYQEIPPAAARRGMIVGGMPESIVDTMLAMWARSEGQPATVVADETAELLGRPPHTFAEWVTDHAGAFAA